MKYGSASLASIHSGRGEITHLILNTTLIDICASGSLCHNRWGKVSAYETGYTHQHSYKKLYMILDNGTLTFTTDPHEVSEPEQWHQMATYLIHAVCCAGNFLPGECWGSG